MGDITVTLITNKKKIIIIVFEAKPKSFNQIQFEG